MVTEPSETSRVNALLRRAGEHLSASRFFERYPWPFVVAFITLVAFTIRVHAHYTFWPGQDLPYDQFCATVSARVSSDPAFGAIYRPVVLWHSHTLLYVLAGWLGHVIDPATATRVVYVALAFIGTPAACAWILTEERRSPWGSVLAFPLAYSRSWSFGFLRYAMSAPFFLLTIFTFVALFREKKITRGRAAAYLVSLWLLWMSHSQVFASAGIILVILWVCFLVARLTRAASHPPPHESLPDFVTRTAIALGLSLPALVALAYWFQGTSAQLGALSQSDTWKEQLLDALPEKVSAPILLLYIRKAADEATQALVFLAVVGLSLVIRRLGAKDRGPVPELVVLSALALYFIAPRAMNGQLIGPRYIDVALWALPLCVTPALFSRHKLASLAGASLLVWYCKDRLDTMRNELAGIYEEMKGLNQIVAEAPEGHLTITQVSFGDLSSSEFLGFSFDQNYAYVAARKGYEAPVYDTRYRVAEVRYRDAPPALPMLLRNDPTWWRRPGLLENFDLVLTHDFHPSPQTRVEMDARVRSVGRAGEWELWQRR